MKVLMTRDNEVSTDSRVLKEASSLRKLGYEVTVLAWDRERQFDKKVSTMYAGIGIPTRYTHIKFDYKSRWFKAMAYGFYQIQLFFLILFSDFDVLHACNLFTCFLGFFAAKFRGRKVVYDIFDFAPDSRPYSQRMRALLKKLDFFIINHSDFVIICSDDRKEQIAGSHPKRLEIIYNSPNGSAPNFVGKENRRNRIVYIGGLTPYRLLPELLNVVAESNGFELLIGGFGTYEKMVREFARKNENITFLGRVPYSEVAEIEASSDIMVALYDPVIANHKYASPNKFFEALRLGKPLLMIKETGMTEWLKKYNFGQLISPSEESLKKGLERLADTKDDWTRQKKIMQKLYESRFSWDVMETRLSRLYKII